MLVLKIFFKGIEPAHLRGFLVNIDANAYCYSLLPLWTKKKEKTLPLPLLLFLISSVIIAIQLYLKRAIVKLMTTTSELDFLKWNAEDFRLLIYSQHNQI